MRMPGGWKASSPACIAPMSTPRACAAAAAASALVTLWRPGTASRIAASCRSTTRRNSVPSRPWSTIPCAPTVTPAAAAVQDGGENLLGGRLAVAAGHGDDARAAASAMEGGQVAESGERVAHGDDATAERPLGVRPLDHHGARAAPGRLRQELVPVVGLAADGDEELARPETPAVGRHPREAGAGAQPDELAAGGGEDLLERERRRRCVDGLDHTSLPRARRTSSRSSRWCFTVPTIW